MSLELINTIAGLATVAIVAATAIAALGQLRHLRSGNQTSAMLNVSEKLDGREFRDALVTANIGLAAALADADFRAYEVSILRRVQPPREVDPRFVEMHNAVIRIGNTFEVLGVLVKNRVVDAALFVDGYCGVALGAWKRLQNFIAFQREVSQDDAIWEHFEYLAVISEDWIREHPSSYPNGLRRFQLRNPWPVPPAAPAV